MRHLYTKEKSKWNSIYLQQLKGLKNELFSETSKVWKTFTAVAASDDRFYCGTSTNERPGYFLTYITAKRSLHLQLLDGLDLMQIRTEKWRSEDISISPGATKCLHHKNALLLLSNYSEMKSNSFIHSELNLGNLTCKQEIAGASMWVMLWLDTSSQVSIFVMLKTVIKASHISTRCGIRNFDSHAIQDHQYFRLVIIMPLIFKIQQNQNKI